MCCCKWSRPPRQSKGEKKPLPYTRLAELFAQVRARALAHRSVEAMCSWFVTSLCGAMGWAPSGLMMATLLAFSLPVHPGITLKLWRDTE